MDVLFNEILFRAAENLSDSLSAQGKVTVKRDADGKTQSESPVRMLHSALQARGFRKDPNIKQRFYYTGCKEAEYEVDVVPFGGVEKPDENIYWPPEESPRMSMESSSSGFLVFRHSS